MPPKQVKAKPIDRKRKTLIEPRSVSQNPDSHAKRSHAKRNAASSNPFPGDGPRDDATLNGGVDKATLATGVTGSTAGSTETPAADAAEHRQLFEAWLDFNEVKWADRCQLAEIPGRGAAVVAARDIAVGEVVLSVPDDAVLMPDDCCISQELEEAELGHDGAGGRFGESVALVLALMAERASGADSRWDGYIASLPEALPGSLVSWSDYQLEALTGTSMYDRYMGQPLSVPTEGRVAPTWMDSFDFVSEPTVDGETFDASGAIVPTSNSSSVLATPKHHPWNLAAEIPTQVEATWTVIVRPFVQRYPHRFDSSAAYVGRSKEQAKNKRRLKRVKQMPLNGAAKAAVVDDEDDLCGPLGRAQSLYLWATAVVAAYSFELGDDCFQAMVPLWDMLNHVTGMCNVRLHHNEVAGALEMIATAAVPAGGELINSYGDLGSGELLRRFGFVESSPNPHDCVHLSWCELWASARAAHESDALGNEDASEPPSDPNQTERGWDKLVRQKAAPLDGWFEVPLSGIPPLQLLRMTAAAICHFAPAPDSLQCAALQTKRSIGAGKRDIEKKRSGKRSGERQAAATPAVGLGRTWEDFTAWIGSAAGSAEVLPVVANVIDLLTVISSRHSEAATRPLVTQLASGGAGVPEVALEGPKVDRGSDSWRRRAAAVVAAREAQCWRALSSWLECPGAAESVRETLVQKEKNK